MLRKITLSFILLHFFIPVKSQCDTTYISSDYTQSSDIIMSGVYFVDGDFVLPAGITIYITEFAFNGCGALVIHADNITIHGTINGDYAGYEGGDGGNGGSVISSLTGHINALTDCQNKDDAGRVEVQGGLPGQNGNGPGAGIAGSDGVQGSGPKQQCLTGDEGGMIGGSGGAGGGSGGTYGGQASPGGAGGDGSNDYTNSGFNVSAAYAVVGGDGGSGGTLSSVYGTADGFDIEMGSGGAGSGGGGRSFDSGLNGGDGGNGGGMIKLVTPGSLIVSGIISVNGEDGEAGGNGGSGGVTPKCCSDGCDDCGEATVSAGAGGGGGAGGGSGGGVFFESGGTISVTGTIYARGGNGGPGGSEGYGSGCTYDAGTFCGDDQSLISEDGATGSTGGAGGGGRVKIFYSSCAGATISPAIVSVDAGTGNGTAGDGTYEAICGYASDDNNIANVDLTIYPNPVIDVLYYSFSESVAVQKLLVYGISGEVVIETDFIHSTDAIDVAFLAPGIYVIQFITGSQIVQEKFIKE